MTRNPSIREYGDAIVDAIRRFGGGGLEKYADHGFRAERILPPERRATWPASNTECIWIPPEAGAMATHAAGTATSMDELFRLLRIAVRLAELRKNTKRRELLPPGVVIRLFDIREEPIDPHMLAEAKKLVLAGYRFDERVENVIVKSAPAYAESRLCGQSLGNKTYKLTNEQSRAFMAALREINR